MRRKELKQLNDEQMNESKWNCTIFKVESLFFPNLKHENFMKTLLVYAKIIIKHI